MSITLAMRYRELDIHNASTMRRIEQETSAHDGPIATARGATPAGDGQRLRGIPAIGRGVGGAIPGTRP